MKTNKDMKTKGNDRSHGRKERGEGTLHGGDTLHGGGKPCTTRHYYNDESSTQTPEEQNRSIVVAGSAGLAPATSTDTAMSRSTIPISPSIMPSIIPLIPLILCATITELLYLLLMAIVSLPGLRFSDTPVAHALPWTLTLSQWLFPDAWSSPAMTLKGIWPYVLLLGITLLALSAIYFYAIRRIRLQQKIISQPARWFWFIAGTTLLFGLTLFFQPRLFSDNVFNSIFPGRILTIYAADPMITAPMRYAHDPYLQWMLSGRAAPNIYGPLWLCIAALLVSISSTPLTTLFLFKGLALLSHLINCLLVWAIVGRIAPDRRLFGTLLYAWNPLALLELAGNGQNEGILLMLLLLATWLYVRYSGRRREIGVLVLLGLAVSMSVIALIFVPPFVWFLVRNEHRLRRAVVGFCWRTGIVCGVIILYYAPFWHGGPTFLALTSAIDLDRFINSPTGLLDVPVRWFYEHIKEWAQFPDVMESTSAADATLRSSAAFIFLLIYIHLFSKVRHAAIAISKMEAGSDADAEAVLPSFDVLLDSLCSSVFWYLILVSGIFWPWYMLWVLWIIPLRRFDARSITIVLLASTALLIYPCMRLVELPVAEYQALLLLIFGIPLAYLSVQRIKSIRRTERIRSAL